MTIQFDACSPCYCKRRKDALQVLDIQPQRQCSPAGLASGGLLLPLTGFSPTLHQLLGHFTAAQALSVAVLMAGMGSQFYNSGNCQCLDNSLMLMFVVYLQDRRCQGIAET